MHENSFAARHIGPRNEESQKMLQTVGAQSLDQLIQETVPAEILLKAELDLPRGISESNLLEHLRDLGNKNKLYKTYIGLGYHPTITPAVIQRNILENPGWYTAYTPYQAEIAQGRLEALLNFQTTVVELTGMELANASLLDEATAASEAMLMLFETRNREQKSANSHRFFVSSEVLPQTLSVLATRAEPFDIELVVGDEDHFTFDNSFFGALLQYPAKSGKVQCYQDFTEKANLQNIRVVVAADLLSLAILTPPGEWGAEIVVGTTQRFGIPMGYGGPHAAYFATKEIYKRNIPGRIIGITKDADGHPALRMALQTREQHIKRDKATSNICTAQVLLAVMAGMYAVYHGPEGLKKIARNVHQNTQLLYDGLERLGYQPHHKHFFDTLLVSGNAKKIKALAEQNEINFYFPTDDSVSITLNETTDQSDVEKILAVFAEASGREKVTVKALSETALSVGANSVRKSNFLQEEVFNRYHSETELMRYIKKLERKDLSLNHSMISLGSCTMKLNAAAEMLPLSWPQWNQLHPFVPANQSQGYQEMLSKLEHQLNIITGFAATSLQPNSGAQGEYAGLMVIRAFHASRGESHRNICLIPSSAHGTNPASAVMAGMKVIVTKTTQEGNIDVEDLRQKAQEHKDHLAALMVTYPSTHGVYESSICEITRIIHDNGGQVYMDGANMNAQVGLTNPATIGADVCHLNLHKTFAIPHGGGGPGVGPICVAKHLAPFLPANPIVKTGGEQAISAISAAPWGSALVCLISYAYITLLGRGGLKTSTQYAILNANYIKHKLQGAFDVLYAGENGRVAHEMILDCRPFKEQGVEVTDIAKRLMDYGFHAPTVSFPVAGTLMVEPTESESLQELDRFCEALLSIRREIDELQPGDTNNPLKNAPHTLELITADDWNLPYSRQKAAFPLEYIRENKFWPSVRRVDDAYGDRNLICTCAPIEAYA